MTKKFHILKVTLFLILVGTLLTGCFDELTVEGVVMDKNGNPIAGATVYSSVDTAETDQDGKWSANASGETDTITISKVGYEFEPSEVTVSQDEELESITFIGKDIEQLFITPNEGEYLQPVAVSLIMGGDYTIYYTLDGSEPSATSLKYTAPFELTETTTVKAIAINNVDDSITSDVVSATYEIADLELVKNGGFDDGLDHWAPQGGEHWISLDREEYGSEPPSLYVSERTDQGHGPMQYIDGFDINATYEISFKIKYDDPNSPKTRQFNLTYRDYEGGNVSGWVGGEAVNGEWSTISDTVTFDDLENFNGVIIDPYIYIETSWRMEQIPEEDWMDFWVDDISIKLVP